MHLFGSVSFKVAERKTKRIATIILRTNPSQTNNKNCLSLVPNPNHWLPEGFQNQYKSYSTSMG